VGTIADEKHFSRNDCPSVSGREVVWERKGGGNSNGKKGDLRSGDPPGLAWKKAQGKNVKESGGNRGGLFGPFSYWGVGRGTKPGKAHSGDRFTYPRDREGRGVLRGGRQGATFRGTQKLNFVLQEEGG